jgi:hypothetical protein
MRYPYCFFAVVTILISGCTESTGSAQSTTAPAPTTQTASSLAGRWTGSANIAVNWTRQKQLPVQLEIAADGSLSGTVGDASLVNAKLSPSRGSLQRSLGWGRDYRIHGQLKGDLIKAETIRRDAVDIVFDQLDENTLVGGLTSSGTDFGGKESMKLAAGNMKLIRAD